MVRIEIEGDVTNMKFSITTWADVYKRDSELGTVEYSVGVTYEIDLKKGRPESVSESLFDQIAEWYRAEGWKTVRNILIVAIVIVACILIITYIPGAGTAIAAILAEILKKFLITG